MSVPDPALTDWVPLATLGGGGVDYKGAWAAGTAYIQGDVVRFNGIDYLAVNPSTGQTPGASAGSAFIGTSLPGSPIDGQEFILVDSLTAPTYSWRFRYVASITDAYKWIFLGGSDFQVNRDASDTLPTNQSSYYALTGGPVITVPRAGIYMVDHGFAVTNFSDSGQGPQGRVRMSYDIGATPAVDADSCFMYPGSSVVGTGHTMTTRPKTFTSGIALTSKYRIDQTYGTNVSIEKRWIRLTPVRVS